VKSTGLFMTDPGAAANGVTTDYWKTGHSYIKRRVNELGALAGFEKSGHFFFNAPSGAATTTASSRDRTCEMLDRNHSRKSGTTIRNSEPHRARQAGQVPQGTARQTPGGSIRKA
jgi:phosphomannomutase / phosphoglucomutase